MRQTNIELLRILSMLFVVMVHLDGAALSLPIIGGNISQLSHSDIWQLAVQSITIVGVNCFTLISGYFGIRASVKGFTKFTFMCLYYSVGIATLAGIAGAVCYDTPFSWSQWAQSWLVYSHNDLWYVPAYMGLFLLSPIINASIKSISSRSLAYATSAFTLYTVWCGWWWGGSFNPSGYTILQLVMMYLIGACVRRYLDGVNSAERARYVWPGACIYLIFTAATMVMAVFMEPLKAFAYNSPTVILASTGLLIAFSSLKFESRRINNIAAGAFAVYLIHKNPFIWGNVIKPLAQKMWAYDSLLQYTFFVLGFAIATYMACWLIDLLRRYVESLLFNHLKIDSRKE